MNDLTKLEWDSDFFKFNVGLISEPKCDVIEITDEFKLVVVNQSEDKCFKIHGYEEKYCECRVLYSKKEFSKKDLMKEKEPIDFDKVTRFADYFYTLAFESGKYSRFLLDHNFGKKEFFELYKLWVINSINKSYADKIFYFEENNKAIAFATLQIKNSIGKIGLISTLPSYQGNGFGRKLIEYIENFCLSLNVNEIVIPTQKENLEACSFYEKLGYNVSEKYYIKHYWKI